MVHHVYFPQPLTYEQNKALDAVKTKASPASATPSRATSVASNGSATKPKGKGKKT
jgi:SWI/SNF-related matrix-associated actin-dependent regulator of chromatin subfamily A member 5